MLGGVVAVQRDGLIANDAGRAVCGLSASKFGTKPGPLQGINYQHQTRQNQACQVSR